MEKSTSKESVEGISLKTLKSTQLRFSEEANVYKVGPKSSKLFVK